MDRLHRMLAVLALAAMALGVGCDKLEKLKELTGKGTDTAGTQDTAAPTGADEGDRQLGQKLNQYIECINHASSFALKSRSRYLGWVDAKTGPTGQEKVVYGLFPLNLVDPCKKALAKAKTMQPPTPELDTAATEYEAALDKLDPLVKKAHDYYGQKNYQDDAMAEGKKMHAPLMAAFDAFTKADDGLRSKIAKVNDEIAERELARIEKTEGKKLLWHWNSTMQKAKHLVRAGDAPDLAQLDLDRFDAALGQYEAAVKALDDYASAHGDEAQKVMMFSSAVGEAKEYLTAAKAMMRRRRDNKPWSQGETMQIERNNGWMVEGHPDQFVRAYNDLVNQSNSLRW